MKRRYDIRFKPSAEKQLNKHDERAQKRIVRKIDMLADDPRPHGVKKLSGNDDFYRIRIGDFRVIYQIQDKILLILIVKIGYRKEVYGW